MSKLSVVISAFNEEEKIKECLESVKFADEIIFVDNSSEDKTAEIADKYTKKIFKQPNDPSKIDLQKNFGFEKATGDWILCIDADERVSEELKEEIGFVVKGREQEANGYWIPRKNIIFGRWIEHTGWYPDKQLRLFRKGKGKYESEYVHEFIKVEGELGVLNNHLIHQNYESINQFVQRTFVYASSEASKLIKNNYQFSFLDGIRFPVKEFLSRFFAREGYKDGFYGLMLSILMAFYHFMIFAYIWEKEKYKQMDEDELLNKGRAEVKIIQKEVRYWILNTQINKTKSVAKKILLKAKRKVG